LASAAVASVTAMTETMDHVADTQELSLSEQTAILHSDAEVIAKIRAELAAIKGLYELEREELEGAKTTLKTTIEAHKLGGMSLRNALGDQLSTETMIADIQTGKSKMKVNHRRMSTVRSANQFTDLSALGTDEEVKIFEAALKETQGNVIRIVASGEKFAYQVGTVAYDRTLGYSEDVLANRKNATNAHYTAFRESGVALARAILTASSAGVEQAQVATGRLLGMSELFSQTAETVVELPGVALIDLVSAQHLRQAAQKVLANTTGEGKPLAERINIASRIVRGKGLSVAITKTPNPLEALAITSAANNIGKQ